MEKITEIDKSYFDKQKGNGGYSLGNPKLCQKREAEGKGNGENGEETDSPLPGEPKNIEGKGTERPIVEVNHEVTDGESTKETVKEKDRWKY